MQVINLKQNFEPLGHGTLILAKSFVFSGGEIGVQVTGTVEKEVTIVTRIQNSNDAMELFMVTDAIHRMGGKMIHLFLPYLPYARQDRVVTLGEAHSLAVFTKLLISQGYESVTVFDPHSEASANLMSDEDFRLITNHAFVRLVLKDKSNYLLVSPDAGAAKKIKQVAEAIGYTSKPIQALKYRLIGGKIDSIEIYENDLGGRDVYIVDDICDGGATFIALAIELRKRNVGRIYLVVSHGIFSKGLDVLKDGGIDHVFTTDSFKSHETNSYLTEVQLCTIL